MTATAVVEAQDLSVIRNDFTLLAPLNFTLGQGRNLVVGGDNGSGKTTLLSVLTGLLTPSSGTITVFGTVPDDRRSKFRARVTGLISRAPISRELTVAEHLEAIAMSWSLSEPRTAALDQLEELEIDFLADRFPHELSSGQSQLMQLAMVLVRPAKLIVIDEPEQRLDSSRLDMVITLLKQRSNTGTSLVLASHSPRVIDRLGDEQIQIVRHRTAPIDEES